MTRYALAALLILLAGVGLYYGPRFVVWVALLLVSHAEPDDPDGAR